MLRFDTIFSEAQCVSSELKYIYIYILYLNKDPIWILKKQIGLEKPVVCF